MVRNFIFINLVMRHEPYRFQRFKMSQTLYYAKINSILEHGCLLWNLSQLGLVSTIKSVQPVFMRRLAYIS